MDQPFVHPILGAGNCNNLDLPRRRNRFAAIDVVDCHCRSVLEGIARQGLATDSAIRVIGPIDFWGIAGIVLAPAVNNAQRTTQPKLSPHITGAAVSQPWLWESGQRVYAFRCRPLSALHWRLTWPVFA